MALRFHKDEFDFLLGMSLVTSQPDVIAAFVEIRRLRLELTDERLAFEHANEIVGKLERSLVEALHNYEISTQRRIHCWDT